AFGSLAGRACARPAGAGRTLPQRLGLHRPGRVHRALGAAGGQVPGQRQAATPSAPRLAVPPPDALRGLAPFPGIGPSRIRLVASAEEAGRAHEALARQAHLAFDTESRPTFVRGERSEGPHVVQFATLDQAWVFQLNADGVSEVAASLITSASVTKVGFGLD